MGEVCFPMCAVHEDVQITVKSRAAFSYYHCCMFMCPCTICICVPVIDGFSASLH